MHPSSSFAFSCFQTPSSALGQCRAGVGKHLEKLAYEFVFKVEVKAWLKILESATKRGPGVDAVGNDGGGDGEDDEDDWPDGIASDMQCRSGTR